MNIHVIPYHDGTFGVQINSDVVLIVNPQQAGEIAEVFRKIAEGEVDANITRN